MNNNIFIFFKYKIYMNSKFKLNNDAIILKLYYI